MIRLDILESVAVAVAESHFMEACLLFNRFIECSPEWTQPQQAMGQERALWEAIVAQTNFWKQRYMEMTANPEAMTPEELSQWTEKMRWWLTWHNIIFNKQDDEQDTSL